MEVAGCCVNRSVLLSALRDRISADIDSILAGATSLGHSDPHRSDRRTQIAHRTGRARILQQRADHVGSLEIDNGIADLQPPAERFGAGPQHRKRLRMHLMINKKCF